MAVMTVKQENGKFYYKTSRGEFKEFASNIKSLEDIKKHYSTDIELIGKVEGQSDPGIKGETVEVLRYNGTQLLLRDAAGERLIPFPNADRNQIQSYLQDRYKKVIPFPLFARLKGQTRDEEEIYNQWAKRQPEYQKDPHMKILADWQQEEIKTE